MIKDKFWLERFICVFGLGKLKIIIIMNNFMIGWVNIKEKK